MAYLQLENLSFSYPILEGEKKVYSHLSFSFPSSGLVCIIGESGCGKSTLLHLIGGYLIPDEGEIKTDFDILDTGIVFQSLYLIEHLNLQDNVALGLVLKGEKRENARKISEEILTKLGLDGYLNSDVNKLSGGQKARGNIARTLSNKTSLLLLDEPTGSLVAIFLINPFSVITILNVPFGTLEISSLLTTLDFLGNPYFFLK